MEPETMSMIIELRDKLQSIGSISFAYNKINKENPLDTLYEEDAQRIIKVYLNLVERAKTIINSPLSTEL